MYINLDGMHVLGLHLHHNPRELVRIAVSKALVQASAMHLNCEVNIVVPHHMLFKCWVPVKQEFKSSCRVEVEDGV